MAQKIKNKQPNNQQEKMTTTINQLTAEEFDKKYNKRDNKGKIIEASVLNAITGELLFHGTVKQVNDYMDDMPISDPFIFMDTCFQVNALKRYFPLLIKV